MDLAGNIKNEKKFVRVLFFLSLLQLLPFFILRENTSIPVNDTMDVYIPQYKLTASNEFVFCAPDKPVPQIMNGLNRDLLVSDLSVIYVLFLLFSPFWAFTLNLLLIKIIAFIGMYLFLKNNFSTLSQKQIAIGAFLFSCIPFFPFFGIGIAGQPLLINALINIYRKRQEYIDYLILLLFPFYSSLVFTNIFLIFSIGLVCAYLLLRDKKIPFRLLIATTVFFLLGVLVDYRLIHATTASGFIPHRVEFDFGAFVTQSGIKGFILAIFKILSTGIFHVETFYSVFVFVLFALYMLKMRSLKIKSILFAALFYTGAIGFLYGLTHSSFYGSITDKITFLKAFQIDRFYTLLPFLYFLLAVICVQTLLENSSKQRKYILNVTIILAAATIFLNSVPIRSIVSLSAAAPPYAEYYDSPALKQVQESIAAPQSSYRMVGVGIDPQVLQYNGFYTLDAYLNIYPLAYKTQFRPVIAAEIEKSAGLKAYFEAWGNRCYVFSAEIGRDLNKQDRSTNYINELNINPQALKALYDKDIYLLSTKIIKNSDAIGLQLVKEFASANRFRSGLILYRVL